MINYILWFGTKPGIFQKYRVRVFAGYLSGKPLLITVTHLYTVSLITLQSTPKEHFKHNYIIENFHTHHIILLTLSLLQSALGHALSHKAGNRSARIKKRIK